MKNKLLIGLLAILLVSVMSANAGMPTPPYTFAGAYYIYEEPCENCEISFRYMDSQEDTSWKTTQTHQGWYQFTNKLFDDGDWYRPGDRIEIKFCNDNVKSACKQIVKFGEGAGTITNVQIEEDHLYSILEPKGDTIIIISDSGVVIVGPEPIKVCDDGSEPLDGKCPTDIWNELFYVFIGILGVFGFGAGFIGLLKYYWTTKGTKLIRDGKTYNSPEMIAEGRAYRRRAMKMGLTAIKNAALGKYDQYKKG